MRMRRVFVNDRSVTADHAAFLRNSDVKLLRTAQLTAVVQGIEVPEQGHLHFAFLDVGQRSFCAGQAAFFRQVFEVSNPRLDVRFIPVVGNGGGQDGHLRLRSFGHVADDDFIVAVLQIFPALRRLLD
ncbi:hypothetical protein D3C81_1526110 [compost metagenome]